MPSLILGIRYPLFAFQRVKIDDVDFGMKIKNLKENLSKKTNLHKENLELVYCGNILDDEVTLSSSGLKPGVMVHVLKKKAKALPKPIPTMTQKGIKALVTALHALKLNRKSRNFLQKLNHPDILDNIVMMTPGLSHDPVAMSLIQDPELLVRLGDMDTVMRILENHPALVEVANHIVAALDEDTVDMLSVQPSVSRFSYSLEALSEDEEMDSSQSSDSQTFQQQSVFAITAAQLATAIASASNNATLSTSLDSSGITSEMFNQAMQQAIANVTPSTVASSTQRVKIDDVDFGMKIKNLKENLSKKTNLHKENLELVYCGNILDDEVTLSSSGLKPGVMVHVLKKKAKALPKPIPTMTQKGIKALVTALHALKLNRKSRNFLQKLNHPDILDNIVMMTPGLSHDPVAMSLIQDPELLVRLGDMDTVMRILENHPALVEVANHIVAALDEDTVDMLSVQPSVSRFSYSLEALSEDEEMDSSQSSDSQTFQQQSVFAITAAQLATAIASASNNATLSTSLDSSGITSEMFNQAMQQAIANVTPSTVASSTQVFASTSGTEEASGQQLAQQMQQMQELGLTNDVLNIQALQLSGGNVYAAIDLVFSGAIGPNS